ncbi:hypothetical protein AGMMS49940_07560 [Spirochaetia bacterium]|nr:hypothetical protein AGMMS49940_07560 [Spirochaetia bacterium]
MLRVRIMKSVVGKEGMGGASPSAGGWRNLLREPGPRGPFGLPAQRRPYARSRGRPAHARFSP